MYLKFIMPPIAGALIGWFTNYVAIKLLFRPLRPVKVLWFNVQGLIPKRRAQIARSIAQTIESELLDSSDFSEILSSIDWKGEIEHVINDLVDDRLTSERLNKIPILGFVSDNLKTQIKQIITKDILAKVDEKKDAMRAKLADSVDVRRIVTERIDNLDIVKFEGLLQGFISRELKHLEWLGALMGLIIGIIQSVVFIFMS